MRRALVLVVLLAALGGCAASSRSRSVRAPTSECTDRCFSAYLGADARAGCLITCTGASARDESCPTPPSRRMACVDTAAPAQVSAGEVLGDIAGEIVGGIFRELVLALLTAPFH